MENFIFCAFFVQCAKRRDSVIYYESPKRKWDNWCSRKQIDLISDTLNLILDNLAESTTESFSVGNHPAVYSLFKEVFNEKTYVPRYKFV